MSIAQVDAITLVLFLAVWPLWGIWELVLLALRAKGVRVRTISMVAKDRGAHLNSVVYLWAGLGAHYWWNGPAWAPVWSAVVFWFVAAGLVVQDALLWSSSSSSWPRWLRWSRSPWCWLVLGVLAGRFLFPQAGGSL